MDKKTISTAVATENKVCFKCGEHLNVQSTEHNDLICEYCEEANQLPETHFYMLQYYYQYAD